MKTELLVPAKRRKPGHPGNSQPIKKVSVEIAKPETLEKALANLLFLDARDLDRSVRNELLRILPVLVHSGRAWRTRFAEYGCVHCHKKNVPYGAGGFCNRCATRESCRMREWYRKIGSPERALEARSALTRKYDAAQLLLNGGAE